VLLSTAAADGNGPPYSPGPAGHPVARAWTGGPRRQPRRHVAL